MSLLQEIALEMSIKTGQVYTCPAENLIQGPEHAYYIRPRTYPKPERLAVNFTGPDNKGHYKNETITLDPKRKPEALARDILNRLPPEQAKAYYRETVQYLQAEAEKDHQLQEMKDFFTDLMFKPYWRQTSEERFYKNDFSVGFYRSNVREIELTLKKLTPEEVKATIELIESMRQEQTTCQQ